MDGGHAGNEGSIASKAYSGGELAQDSEAQ